MVMTIGGDQLPNAMELRTTCGGGDDDRSHLQSYPYLPLDKTVTLINNTDSQCLTLCSSSVLLSHSMTPAALLFQSTLQHY